MLCNKHDEQYKHVRKNSFFNCNGQIMLEPLVVWYSAETHEKLIPK